MKTLFKSAIVAALALTFVGCEMESKKPSHEKDKKANGLDQGSNKVIDKEGNGVIQKDAPKPSSEY